MVLIRQTLVLFTALTVLTGIFYPLAVTGVAQLLFPRQANGSVIEVEGKPVGSELIGQPFHDPKYFWPRPSATPRFPYNAAASSGSNLGPTNPALLDRIADSVSELERSAGGSRPVPVDLVTASASGLDPHISPAAAEFQVARVARVRGLAETRVRELVQQFTDDRTFGLLGEPCVNVLRLNTALDSLVR